jgi:repressor of nif and glnA expression
MIGQESRTVERKTIAILKVLSDCPEPLGGKIIARRLSDLGVELGERAVRYHLQLMDQQGLTRAVGKRDGRLITKSGIEELDSALVTDRISLIIGRMEMLAYQSYFDAETHTGTIPINVSLFPRESFKQAIKAMKESYKARLSISQWVAVAHEGEKLGDTIVPKGKIGLATVSNILIIGTLLKAGIPVDFKFGGILQMRDRQPLRFANLIEYSGSSLDPSEIFIAGKMTSVRRLIKEGNGGLLATFCELPGVAHQKTEDIVKRLEVEGLGGVIKLGKSGESICEIAVAPGRAGIILLDGLNPVAAAAEAGFEVVNRTISSLSELNKFKSFQDLSVVEEP